MRGHYVEGLFGGLSEGYGHDGPGVCLGDGQTEAYLKDMGMTGLTSILKDFSLDKPHFRLP